MLASRIIDIDIHARRGGFALDVGFQADGGLTALFGRSGAGKSTVIAAVAGLVRPERGRIAIGGTTLFDAATGLFVPPHRRRIGLVFQDAQLLPHLSVRQNLAYGRWFAPRDARRLDFDAAVEVLGIGALLARRPASLSGGERQRVAIGRALLSAPRILLMDEPLAALDVPRKREILPLIERLRDEFAIPILYVSHAMEEVARLASQVVLIEAGRVQAVGAPETVLGPLAGSPSDTRFNTVSLITARVRSHDTRYGLTLLDHPAGEICVPGRDLPPGALTRVLVHGADVTLALERPRDVSVRTVLAGTIRATTLDDGPVARVDLALPGGETLATFVTRKSVDELGLGAGGAVFAMIKAASIEEGAGRG
ncbi:molybdenum ABC transporter ATP-binding protein [Labrys wisconsinensis]|uniref:Molybdate transport system ATP-binding protein n=1 Tax=Labrys wisconsinensis TaxID=425677 RepID=A0ABU0J1T9_9HYPH|nr:molybdenum ABC transporter ATP-binding protein [Labrys wisconsinensis]MDQ0468215.1 molybdate transport system ATP-binding protein [Labrys wisconsinensis]